jgi:hypothetical protein
MAARVSVLGRSGGQVADGLECLFGRLHRPEDGLLDPKQRERQLVLGEVEDFLAPLVVELAPRLEQLAQLGIVGRDLARELPPCLEVVAGGRGVEEETAGEGAQILARGVIELLELAALLSDLDGAASDTRAGLAQALLRCPRRRGCHPLAGLVQVLLSLSQCRLGVGQLFPQPPLALGLGLEPRERIGVFSSGRLG